MIDDYAKDLLDFNFHVTQVISCPYRAIKDVKTYRVLLGTIWDLGIKEFYKDKGYLTDVEVTMKFGDKWKLVGHIDMVSPDKIIEVKLTDFNEVTVKKGLLQVFTYAKMFELQNGERKKPELWCYGLKGYKIFTPTYGDKTFNKIMERCNYIWLYLNKTNKIPRIPSRLDCQICREKFSCPVAFKCDVMPFKVLALR